MFGCVAERVLGYTGVGVEFASLVEKFERVMQVHLCNLVEVEEG